MKKRLKRVMITGLMCLTIGLSSCNKDEGNLNLDSFENNSDGFENNEEQISKIEKVSLNKIGSYDTKIQNEDGGVAEIVKYNKDNNKLYLVNGFNQSIDIVEIQKSNKEDSEIITNFDENKDRIYAYDIVNEHKEDFADDFEVGDITSLAINENLDLVVVSIQHKDYSKNGAVAVLDYNGKYIESYETGVQPDMITFSNNLVLTADEGEPRLGYQTGTDPLGSVTVINLDKKEKNTIDFKSLDTKKDELVENGVILMKDANPSLDLEPEYISVVNNVAYVSLQEANSIMKINLLDNSIIDVKGLGFKNHNLEGNEIDLLEDLKANPKNEDVYGVFMPDTITSYVLNEKTYIVTANEGDAREWEEFSGIKKETSKFVDEDGKATKVEVLNNELWEGLEEDKSYILGARSFSILDAETLEMVYDSGSLIEKELSINELTKNYFNCGNDNLKMDNRSKKKGPEVEAVDVSVIGEQVFIYVGLERISGVMTFDASNFNEVKLMDYANTRDFSRDIAGDVSPECVVYVDKKYSINNKNLIILSNEVSGTISIYQMDEEKKEYIIEQNYIEKEIETKDYLMISSVYGDGNKGQGPISHNYISIINPTNSNIDLSEYKLIYKSQDVIKEIKLEGEILALKSYVILGEKNNTESVKINFDEGDYNISINDLIISNKTYQIELYKGEDIIDRVGVVEENEQVESEGTAVKGISKQKIIYRKDSKDTNNNIVDFEVISIKDLTIDEANIYKPIIK